MEQPNSGMKASLPTQLTALVGRARAVTEVAGLLARPDVRLVTLTGPGGVGKTRLAIEVARAADSNFADGARFVDLAPIADPGLVPATIAQALGVSDAGGGQATDRLVGFLYDRSLLLVLDNFERVVEAAPPVAALLRSCPDLAILTTSRVPLRVSGEREYPVTPLELVESATPPSLEAVMSSAAARLFVELAQGVRPDIVLDTETAPAVAEICRRLDGLPLAIELAAARAKVLPPAALLDRLERRLPLLTKGGRHLPERQRTMRDTIAWSHDLLTSEEQRLFRRLAVFVGGFTLEAVEAVVGDDLGIDVLDGIGALADASLLQDVGGTGAMPRYAMLETIREYGLERLGANGEAATVRDRHAAWFLSLAEASGADLQEGRNELDWASRLDADLANLRAAVTWLLEAGTPLHACRLLAAADRYWMQRTHHFAELRRWLEAVLAATPNAALNEQAAARYMLAGIAAMSGDHEVAMTHAEEGLAVARSTGDPLLIGRALLAAGLAWEHAEDGARSAEAFAEAIPFVRAAEANLLVADVLMELGDKLVWCGDLPAGVAALEEARGLIDRFGYRSLWPMWLGQRAHAARAQNDLPLAARLFAESVEVARQVRDERVMLGAVAGLAGVALRRGEAERATRLLAAAHARREAAGLARIAHALHLGRIAAETRNQLGEQTFYAAWADGAALSWEPALADALALADETQAVRPLAAVDDAHHLTPRERQVLQLIVTGKSDREIGEALFIGTRTVETHVSNVLAKLGVGNRVEAAMAAVRRGLA